MSDEKTKDIPIGWTKGSPLEITKRPVKGRSAWCIVQDPAWFIKQALRCPPHQAIHPDTVAVIWFYTADEAEAFKDWWHDSI